MREEQAEGREILNPTYEKTHSLLPPYVYPLLRSMAFHATVIDSQDGVTEPITEDVPDWSGHIGHWSKF